MSFKNFKLGLRRSSEDPRDYDYKLKVPMNVKLPLSYDIIPRGIYNQSNIGSCSSNAIANQIMALKSYDDNTYPSRLYQYYNSRLLEGNEKSDSGATYRSCYKALAKFGFCDEKLWEYDTTKYKDEPSKECYDKSNTTLIKKYQSLIPSIYAIEYALSQNKIVCIGVMIYDNFNDYNKSDFIIPFPCCGGALGGHAMAICGYDHIKRLFKIVNSWGYEWGDGGFAYMRYEHVLSSEHCFDFWCISKDDNEE